MGTIKDGFHALPSDRLATLVTWLCRDVPEVKPTRPLPEGMRLKRLVSADISRYLALFRAVGERWMWFSRLQMEPAALKDILDSPAVSVFALVSQGEDIGLLEMDYREAELPELSFLGLVPEAIGQGFGRMLMDQAFEHARAHGVSMLHLHSCTFDHPGAVAFYQAMGFAVTRREVEVFVDPRIDGILAPDAVAGFPHVKGD